MSSIGSDARRLNGLHRISSLLVGIMLLVFGVLGFTNNLDFFSTTGSPVLGLSTNLLLSTVSVVVGAVLGLTQTDVKRMIAYSSIAHAGFALLGLVAADSEVTV